MPDQLSKGREKFACEQILTGIVGNLRPQLRLCGSHDVGGESAGTNSFERRRVI